MVERIAEIIILVEDLRQANLARHYLIRCGHHPRNIRISRAPRARGSGEQFVREQYPDEVAYYRKRSKVRKAALVVVVDADKGTVEEHERELDDALAGAEQTKREPAEQIALLIPRRHVETWVLCLSGEIVNEIDDYKRRAGIDNLIKPAAGALYEWSRSQQAIPPPCVPSLRNGLSEVRRVG